MRPPMPVPAMRLTSMLCSRARRRTAGERRLAPRAASPSVVGGGMVSATATAMDVAGGGVAGGDAIGMAAASSATWASTAEPPVGPTGRASVMRYAVGVGGVALAGAADGADAGIGGPPAASATSAMGAPMGTVSPSWAMMRSSSPVTGDGTSIVTLSVMTSTSGS